MTSHTTAIDQESKKMEDLISLVNDLPRSPRGTILKCMTWAATTAKNAVPGAKHIALWFDPIIDVMQVLDTIQLTKDLYKDEVTIHTNTMMLGISSHLPRVIILADGRPINPKPYIANGFRFVIADVVPASASKCHHCLNPHVDYKSPFVSHQEAKMATSAAKHALQTKEFKKMTIGTEPVTTVPRAPKFDLVPSSTTNPLLKERKWTPDAFLARLAKDHQGRMHEVFGLAMRGIASSKIPWRRVAITAPRKTGKSFEARLSRPQFDGLIFDDAGLDNMKVFLDAIPTDKAIILVCTPGVGKTVEDLTALGFDHLMSWASSDDLVELYRSMPESATSNEAIIRAMNISDRKQTEIIEAHVEQILSMSATDQ